MSSHTKETRSSKADTGTALLASNLSDSQRRHDVEVAAYYIAEKDRFNSGCDVENWLTAEAEIDLLRAGGKGSSHN